jgi:magnesium-transporting ATPase (P-type)
MKKYYVLIEDKQSGPFTIENLKEMELKDNDLVWEENTSDWINASEISDLKDSIIKTPPPLPNSRFRESKIFSELLLQAFILLALLFSISFYFLKGFSDDIEIEKCYRPEIGIVNNVETLAYNSPINHLYINYDGNIIRYDILLPLSLLISFCTTMLIIFIEYRLNILKEIKKLNI